MKTDAHTIAETVSTDILARHLQALPYMLIGDGWTEKFATLQEAVDHPFIDEAWSVHHHDADVTTDAALLWAADKWLPDYTLPECFESALRSEQMNQEEEGCGNPNAEHSTMHRGIGI